MSDQVDKNRGDGPSAEARYGQLCEYVFGEMGAPERAAFELELAADVELQKEHAELVAIAEGVRNALPVEKLPDSMRATLSRAAQAGPGAAPAWKPRGLFGAQRGGLLQLAAGILVFVGVAFAINALLKQDAPQGQDEMADSGRPMLGEKLAQVEQAERLRSLGKDAEFRSMRKPTAPRSADSSLESLGESESARAASYDAIQESKAERIQVLSSEVREFQKNANKRQKQLQSAMDDARSRVGESDLTLRDSRFSAGVDLRKEASVQGAESAAAPESVRALGRRSSESGQGESAAAPNENPALVNSVILPEMIYVGRRDGISVIDLNGFGLDPATKAGAPVPPLDPGQATFRGAGDTSYEDTDSGEGRRALLTREQLQEVTLQIIFDCERRPQETPSDMFFRAWGEHPFRIAAEEPLSTFGADVDTASYTMARRTLRSGYLPAKEQVRSEEFLNYFRADMPAPERGEVFGLHLESAPSLFHADPMVDMLRVTLRGQDVQDFERKPLALTLVIDASGSMKDGSRMPLVKRALALLLTQLSYADNVSIVAFSTQATVLSEMTSAANRGVLEEAIYKLNANGGTNIESGIATGFRTAAAGMVEGAVNRVILLSDGVGNIGETDQRRILESVDAFRQKGIYLNTIGVGMGDHNDNFLEQLADRGDGMCQYFDSAREAEKVLVNDLTKTLQPIARDVKIQVEFDPSQVQSYRQIGYENRAIASEDFRNDAVDAGEVNAGHQVTALYEIVRYPGARADQPLATARVRYKLPFVAGASELQRARAEEALEITQSIRQANLLPAYRGASWGYRRALLVAQFAECLRRSIHARQDSLQILLDEVRVLAEERDDQELFELKELLQLAAPLLIDEAENYDRELLEMVDALRRLHYEVARREQMRGDKEADQELEEECQRLIQKLEQSIAQLLQKRAGFEEPVQPERLEALGYGQSDDDR